MENPPGWRVDVQKQHLAKSSVIFVSDKFLSAVYHSVAKQCFDWYKFLHCKQRVHTTLNGMLYGSVGC